MSDIFISYAKEDREWARVLAEALEVLGWSVWWDRIIPTGRVFADVIKAEIDAAGCVVVLWSGHSVSSEWVRREAREAAEQKKLFPGLIERVNPPWEFGELHACDLVDWDGKTESGNFPLLVGDLRGILGTPPKQAEEEAERRADDEAKLPPGEASGTERQRIIARKPASDAVLGGFPRWLVLVAVAALMVVLLWWGLFKWSPWVRGDLAGAQEAMPSETVEAEPGAEAVGEERLTGEEAEAASRGEGAEEEPVADQRREEGSPSWDEDAAFNPRILIEGGEFLMGSPKGVGLDHERPQHPVQLSSFYMQEHEVTNEEYRRFVGSHEFSIGHERHPVVEVTWDEAKEYAEWLGGDLPTEAQWEYAARAGSTTRWSFGDDESGLGEYAWYRQNAGRAHPVAQMKPNRWGLYDMHGGVWEWCRDWPDDYPEDLQVDPLNTDASGRRVIRGGSWVSAADLTRSALRIGDEPGHRQADLGFRVVLSAPES